MKRYYTEKTSCAFHCLKNLRRLLDIRKLLGDHSIGIYMLKNNEISMIDPINHTILNLRNLILDKYSIWSDETALQNIIIMILRTSVVVTVRNNIDVARGTTVAIDSDNTVVDCFQITSIEESKFIQHMMMNHLLITNSVQHRHLLYWSNYLSMITNP